MSKRTLNVGIIGCGSRGLNNIGFNLIDSFEETSFLIKAVANRSLASTNYAADQLEKEGFSAEVLDLRSLQPMDEEAILVSLEKTGRLVVVDEATPRCGIASDVAALCVDRGFDLLNAPVKKVTAPHSPVPFSPALEPHFIPDAERVVRAVRELL